MMLLHIFYNSRSCSLKFQISWKLSRVCHPLKRYFSSDADRPHKRLVYLVEKETKKWKRKVEMSPENSRLNQLLDILADKGFKNKSENIGHATVTMTRNQIQQTDPEVDMEFEYRTRLDDDVKLFDVICSKGLDSPRLVFTCNSSPFQILSVRIVPVGFDYLNQDVYDGPDLGTLPANLQKAIIEYLTSCGVGTESADFIEVYGYRKHLVERIYTLEKVADFIKR